MQVWEYDQHTVPLAEAKEACNVLGRDGWEVCAAVPVMVRTPPVARIGSNGVLQQLAGSEQSVPAVLLLVKRPRQADAEATGAVLLAG